MLSSMQETILCEYQTRPCTSLHAALKGQEIIASEGFYAPVVVRQPGVRVDIAAVAGEMLEHTAHAVLLHSGNHDRNIFGRLSSVLSKGAFVRYNHSDWSNISQTGARLRLELPRSAAERPFRLRRFQSASIRPPGTAPEVRQTGMLRKAWYRLMSRLTVPPSSSTPMSRGMREAA